MVSYRADRVDTIRRFYIGLFPDTETVSTLRNGKSIIRVRLRELEELHSRRLCDVPLCLCNRDRKLCFEALHQRFAHNTHEGGVSRGGASARLETYVCDDAEVELLVATLTERAIVVRCVPAAFAAFKVMNMQLDGLLIGSFDATAGAGVVISPEDVLTHVTPRAFNRMPQSSGLGRTSAGAYTFSGNVVLEALRVVNRARGFPQTATSRLVRV